MNRYDFHTADNAEVPHTMVVRNLNGEEIKVAEFFIMPEISMTLSVCEKLAIQAMETLEGGQTMTTHKQLEATIANPPVEESRWAKWTDGRGVARVSRVLAEFDWGAGKWIVLDFGRFRLGEPTLKPTVECVVLTPEQKQALDAHPGSEIDSIHQPIGCDGAIAFRWCGMWLCVEADGYCHS